jgi:hypothetical protein
LWNTPGARRSKIGATMTARWTGPFPAPVVGPEWLGEREVAVILALAEVRGAEQLLQAHDLRPLPHGFLDAGRRPVEVLLRPRGAGHLDQANRELVLGSSHGRGG